MRITLNPQGMRIVQENPRMVQIAYFAHDKIYSFCQYFYVVVRYIIIG